MIKETRPPDPMRFEAVSAAAEPSPFVRQSAPPQAPLRQPLERALASTAPRRFDDIF